MAEDMEAHKLIDTYGKTWHTWQVDRGDELPLGPAQLMMAFTGDGQMDAQTMATRDAQAGRSIEEARAARVELQAPASVDGHADHPWRTGKALQVSMEEHNFKDVTAAK